jgi:hypothetical protein
MTIVIPPRPVEIRATNPAEGCTAPHCGSQNTLWLSPVDGRRCAAHPPTDPGTLITEAGAA